MVAESLLALVVMGAGGGLIGLIIFVLDIVALVSILTGSGSTERKILWTLIVIFLPVVGMILYFLFGKNSA
jgi:hypothetical protein